MSTKATVLKLLHLGDIWKCRKTKRWGTSHFSAVGHDRKFLVGTEFVLSLCLDRNSCVATWFSGQARNDKLLPRQTPQSCCCDKVLMSRQCSAHDQLARTTKCPESIVNKAWASVTRCRALATLDSPHDPAWRCSCDRWCATQRAYARDRKTGHAQQGSIRDPGSLSR